MYANGLRQWTEYEQNQEQKITLKEMYYLYHWHTHIAYTIIQTRTIVLVDKSTYLPILMIFVIHSYRIDSLTFAQIRTIQCFNMVRERVGETIHK